MDSTPLERDRKKRPTRSEDRRQRCSRLLAIAVSAVLGLALLGLAIPRTVAAWVSVEAQPAIERIQLGKVPSDAELARGVVGLQRALAWTPSARRLTDLALLELEQAWRRLPEDPVRVELLASAEAHLVDGLIANPADGFAWFRLAFVRELRGASGRQVAVALVQSLDMAPNMRGMWIARAGFFLAYWRYLKVDELLAMRSHLRTIWSADPAMRLPLLQTAQRHDQIPMISWALGDDPEAQAEFQRLRASMPKSAR